MTQIVNQPAEWTDPRVAQAPQTPHTRGPEPQISSYQAATAQPSRPLQAAGPAVSSPYSDLSRRPVNPMAQAGGAPAATQAFAHPAAPAAADQTAAQINAHLNRVAPAPQVAVPNAVSSLGFPFQDGQTQEPFPAAPSKVLQEQYAQGGTGHIAAVPDPASDSRPQPAALAQEPPVQAPMAPPTGGALLEGVFPYPQAGDPSHHPSATPSAPLPPAGQAQHPVPPAQAQDRQALPTKLETRMADWIEPSMAETSPVGDAARTGDAAAPWQAEQPAVSSGRRSGRPTWALPLVLCALVTLIAVVAYAQLSGAPSVSDPLRVAAPEGPERVLPEDPGGQEIPGIDLTILHPEQVSGISEDARNFLNQDPWVDSNLSPVLIDVIETGASDAAEVQIIEEIDIPITFEGAVAGSTQVEEVAAASASTPASTPQSSTTAQASVVEAARPAAPPIPQASADEGQRASDTAPTVDSRAGPSTGLLASAPTGLYVQEGSYGTLTRAQVAYANLLREAPEQMTALRPAYHQVEVNGQTWVRLYLTGFESGAAARQMGGSLGRRQNQWLVFNG